MWKIKIAPDDEAGDSQALQTLYRGWAGSFMREMPVLQRRSVHLEKQLPDLTGNAPFLGKRPIKPEPRFDRIDSLDVTRRFGFIELCHQGRNLPGVGLGCRCPGNSCRDQHQSRHFVGVRKSEVDRYATSLRASDQSGCSPTNVFNHRVEIVNMPKRLIDLFGFAKPATIVGHGVVIAGKGQKGVAPHASIGDTGMEHDDVGAAPA